MTVSLVDIDYLSDFWRQRMIFFFSTLQMHKKNEGIQDTPFFTLALQAVC